MVRGSRVDGEKGCVALDHMLMEQVTAIHSYLETVYKGLTEDHKWMLFGVIVALFDGLLVMFLARSYDHMPREKGAKTSKSHGKWKVVLRCKSLLPSEAMPSRPAAWRRQRARFH